MQRQKLTNDDENAKKLHTKAVTSMEANRTLLQCSVGCHFCRDVLIKWNAMCCVLCELSENTKIVSYESCSRENKKKLYDIRTIFNK